LAQREKIIKFDDGSLLRAEVLEGGKMLIVLQARHLGEEVKFTATSVELTPDETLDFINWIGDELVKEFSNE
jgi:hypothetical protein